MKIKLAEVSDAPFIYDLIIKDFMEYTDEVPPSAKRKWLNQYQCYKGIMSEV